ncbi:MAG: hypothetical protein PUE57_01710 [Lactimicrobium massiliense]|nr:hypothetical protein [Lactimicrobium massiliense]MDD6674357.1 hypothetical protein [Lactimicrobium massiliense]
MKTTSFKKLTALLVAVVMVFSMCVTGVSVSAATDSSTTTVYLKPNANWTQTNARFAAYLWNDNGNTWVDATDTDGDGYYEVAVPSGYNKVIFTRMNPATKENNWDTKWNQTSDLSIPTDGKNLYTIAEGAWDEGNGEWSTYNQSTSTSQVETTSAPSNTTYLQVNKNWAEGNARFAAYLWNDNGNTWVDATKTSDNVYAVTVPDGYTNVIFTRMNPATTENNWSDVWNQTADLKVELGKVYVMAEGAWDKGNGEWKNFDQPETTAPATEAPATTVAPTTEAPTTAPANTTYLQVNKNWAESNARFAAYLWNDNGNTWVSATKTSDNVYAVTVPDGYTNVIFTRMNPATTENNWSDVWNQTADLKVELGKVYVMAEGAWDKGNGEWKNFDQPATTAPATEATTAPATEAPTTAPANTTYLKVNANWAEANARFAAYLWNDNGNTWVSATKYADGVYAVAVPDGYTNIIFTRMNPATTENNWSDAWNQTADLKVELGKVYVMAEGAWDKGEGEWKNLDQPATTAPATEPATTAPVTTAPVTEPTTVSPSTEPTTAPASGVSVFGDINLDLVKGSDDVYTASTDLEKGTYSFRINNNGTTYCNGATFTDKTTNVAYSTKWKAATKLVANGGTYTFKYNVSTNKLSIEYQAPSLAQIFGDINLDLQATKDANIYSAAIDLKAGSYDFRVMNQGVQYCCKYTYKDITVGSQYNAKWKSASTLVAQGGTYTFSYDIDANKLTISYLPEGAAVSIIGDFTLALQPTENPNVYTATQELKAGSYVIKVNNFGKICGASGVVNDEKSAIVFNPKWSRYTTLKATGGTYTFTYDVSKNVLSIAKEK